VDYDKQDGDIYVYLEDFKINLTNWGSKAVLMIALTKQEADELSAKIDFVRQDQEIIKEIKI
jgi:hypothetical protein